MSEELFEKVAKNNFCLLHRKQSLKFTMSTSCIRTSWLPCCSAREHPRSLEEGDI